MNLSLRRIGAYIIDYIFIFLFLTMINQIRFLNPTFEEYVETYDDYLVLLDDLNVSNALDIVKNDDYVRVNYDLERYSVSITIISVVVYLGYFIGFQMWNKGQTLGKKLFNLQVVSNNNDKVKWWQMVLRNVIVYNLILEVLLIIALFIFNKEGYMMVRIALTIVAMLIFYVNAIFIILRKDGRGLHDLVAGTKVVGKELSNGN